MKKFIKLLRAKRFQRRLKRAIKKADRLTSTTGKKYLVLNFAGKPIVKSKGELKQLVNHNYFKCDIQTLTEMAIYKTF